ncbi:MAG: glycosyltransferase family 4 protein [Flavobacteriales bacterium]|nr:glycosyltransferase family 4 protein [Flavobacteriales bacterium]
MAKLRVLHIIDRLVVGGAEELLKNSINQFIEEHPDIEHTLVCLYAKGKLEEQVHKDCEVLCLELSKKNVLPKIFGLKKLIKSKSIDVIHAHQHDSSLFARLSKPKSVGLISTYHNHYYGPKCTSPSKWRNILDRWTYRSKHLIVFISNEVKNQTVKHQPVITNYEVIYNFCHPRFKKEYQYDSSENLKIVMVGNLRKSKNHHLALEGLGLAKNSNIHVTIYGEGDLRSGLEEIIAKESLNVKLAGIEFITSELLAKFDLFMMTSFHEGMPLTIIEAMRSGLPLLLNDLEEFHEVTQGHAVFFKYNQAEDLALKLNEIQKNKDILKEYSSNSLKVGEAYSPSKYCLELKKLYYSYSSN